MKTVSPLDLRRLRVLPLEQRRSLTRVEDILVAPEQPPAAPIASDIRDAVNTCVAAIHRARTRNAAVILMYGAHLLRNGAALILADLMQRGWLTHVATNGAGTIHDWEYAWLGRSTESVEENVAAGTFGTWDETGRNLHLALLAGALRGEGYGVSLGRMIAEDGVTLPDAEELEAAIRARASAHTCTGRTALRHPQTRFAERPHQHRARMETRLHSRERVPARHSRDRASRGRLRHHFVPPDVQWRSHRAGGGT
jgi:hypothetical protein